MLLVPGLSSYGFTYDNWGANPSTTPGTSVTPGASNAEGSWTQIASTSNIAQDCYWLEVHITDGGTSAATKPQLLDIGVDPAGGTSYTAIISDICCGNSSSSSGANYAGMHFIFPFFIKAGSSVAARVQGANATAGTVRVIAKFWGQPSAPENMPVGTFSETIGAITNSGGVAFTPGNAADGSWTSLGTTTNRLWWWQIAAQVDDATMTNLTFYVDLAFGDVTNKVIINRVMFSTTAVETQGAAFAGNMAFMGCYCPVPAGSTIYIRGRASTTPDAAYNATAIGIGG